MTDVVQAILAADVLLMKEGKILLNRRAGNVFAAGFYDIPGGHVEEGETVLDAAVREMKEELGVTIDPRDLTLIHVIERPVGEDGKRRVNFEFECRKWKGQPKNMEPEKSAELRWVTPDNLPPKTTPYSIQVIQGHQRGDLFSVFTKETELSR